MTWVLTPFLRNMQEDTRTVVTNLLRIRAHGNVDATLFGVLVAAEPEHGDAEHRARRAYRRGCLWV